jgi:H+/gluconate symporter-like permease
VSNTDDRETTVRIRRAPKFLVFIVLGAVLGVLVALLSTAYFPVDPSVGFGATFGYFALYGIVIGALVGAVIAILLDRLLSRRAKTVTASVDRLQIADDDADDEPTDAPAGNDPAAR